MGSSLRILVLVLALAPLVGDQSVGARENLAAQLNEEGGKVFVRDDQIFMWVKANEIVYKAGFFHPSECNIDDGLIVNFKDGLVTAITKGDGFMGGYIAPGTMTFHIGNKSCQITVEVRRRRER